MKPAYDGHRELFRQREADEVTGVPVGDLLPLFDSLLPTTSRTHRELRAFLEQAQRTGFYTGSWLPEIE